MDARLQAARTIFEIHRRRATAQEVWDGPRTGAETALVLGVLRRRGTLDAILRAHSSRKLPLLRPETLAVLRTAAFEIVFLEGGPSHAVVHAAVENCKSFGRFKDTGFVNAVLRSMVRRSTRIPAAAGEDPRRVVPVEGGAVLFHRQVFPHPKQDEAAFLAARGSTALWIARRRLAELGFDRALRCLDLQAATPATHLRPAPGREDDVCARLEERGIPFRRWRLVTVPPQVRVSDVFDACGEWIVVQDAVASQVAPFLAPAPGARVLDFCAAPGGKATHLAQLVGEAGRVTAWDVDPQRLEKVRENAARLGLAQLVCGPPEGEYDAVLVDAPCSNTGVLARRPEARWRVKEKYLQGLAERQLRILRDAAEHVGPGGLLGYSTCSLEAEENQGVVAAFVDRGGFELLETRTCYPDEHEGDGGFMARLRRV